MDGAPWFTVAIGVCENPEAPPNVIRVDGTSRNFKRLHRVTEGFQVRAHLVECQAVEVSNVLTADPSGPQLRDNAAHLRPEVTVVVSPSPAAVRRRAEGLTGESPGEEVDSADSHSANRLGCDIAHVLHDRD
jgi:hypothetical protein